MNTASFILLAGIAAASQNLRGSALVTPYTTNRFASSNAIFQDGAFSMYGVDGRGQEDLPKSAEEQAFHALQKVKSALFESGMSLGNMMFLEISVADIKDWPAVQKNLTSELSATMPAVFVTQAHFLDAAVKVELNVEAASDAQLVQVTAAENDWTIGTDAANEIAYLSGVLSPVSSGSYGDQIAAIMPIVETQLMSIGMDKNNLVMVKVATETTPSSTSERQVEDLKDLNQAYNTAMAGTTLPGMVTWYTEAFPGSEAPGLQILVTVTAARHRQTLVRKDAPYDSTAPQVTAPVPVIELTAPLFAPTPIQIHFPFSYVMPSAGNSVWLTGQGYYGDSTEMGVATTAVMQQTLEKLQEIDLSLDAAVTADVIIVESGRVHMGELVEAYNNFLEAHAVAKPPTLSIRVVAAIDLDSPLEITITARKATTTGKGNAQV